MRLIPFLTCLALPAAAQTPEDILADLFSAPAEADVFAPDFLAAIPLTRVQALIDDLAETVGPVERVEIADGSGTIFTATHRMPVRIVLDGEGRIAGLRIEPPESLFLPLTDAADALEAFGEKTALLVTKVGQTILDRNATEALPVASAFKLGVLAVLARDISAGARQWEDIVRLAPEHLSLPSGQMQDWPVGSPVTLHTAALLMISQSDNTATDLLIDTLGADRIADALGLESLETTRSYFDTPDSEGWRVPLTALCTLMDELADLPLLQVNRGAMPADIGPAAYKGGSLPGVLSFVGQTGDGTCVGAVLLGDDINLNDAVGAYRALVRAATR